MPLYRHECSRCAQQDLDLFNLGDKAPLCCGVRMRRLMPTRVVGRVVPDSDGVHTGSGFAAEGDECEVLARATADMPASTPAQPLSDDPCAIPWQTEDRKDYAECNAGERDARWRDTNERMTTWQANVLERGGVAPTEARAKASAEQQKVTETARAENVRADGLT